MAYRAYHHRVHRRRLIDYFLPLFLFIAFAVIVILSWQLYRSITVKNEPLDMYLYTLQGKSKILPAGTYNWDNAYDGMRVLQGDEVQSLLGSRAELIFFKKFWLRLNEDTTVNLQRILSSQSEDEYEIYLKGGSSWFNADSYTDKHIALNVFTQHLKIEGQGGVFEVEDTSDRKGGMEVIRAITGSVRVAVIVNDGQKRREVEAITVAAGQEFSMDAADYNAYQKYQSPEVLTAIPDDFISDEWYQWNNQKDLTLSH